MPPLWRVAWLVGVGQALSPMNLDDFPNMLERQQMVQTVARLRSKLYAKLL